MNIFPWLILFAIFLIVILILQNAIKFLEKHIMKNMYSKIIFSSVFTTDISLKKIIIIYRVTFIIYCSSYFIYVILFYLRTII